MPSYTDLTAEQLRHIDRLASSASGEGFAVLGVGYGKTVVTLTAIQRLREQHGPLRTLVVSTSKIIQLTWGQEIEAWDHLAGTLTYADGSGGKKKVLKAALTKPDVLGVNFESLEAFYDLVDAEEVELPEILVIDESSRMKAHDANRVKRHCGFGRTRQQKLATPFLGPRGYVHRFQFRFALSATPTAEGYATIWPQECSISRTRRLGVNVTSFRDNFCHAHWNGIRNDYTVSEEGKRRIHDALSDILITTENDSYTGLPEPLYSRVKIPWTKPEYERYQQMEEEALVRLQELEGEVTDVRAPGVAVQLNKLRQLASGFLYQDEYQPFSEKPIRKTHWFDSRIDKLKAVDLIRESADEVPIVVFTQFTAEMELLKQAFPDAQIGLPATLKDWNEKKIPLLVLHPRSAGHGVNLQHGSHIAVWYSLPWSYEEWHQANGRLHRTGQTRQVSIIRLEREKSVDREVWSKLQGKARTLAEFIEGIRERSA